MAMLASQILKRSTKLCSAKALLPSFLTLKFSARSGRWMSKQLQMAFMNSHSFDEDLPKDYNIFSWMPTPRDCLKDLENAAELTEKWDKVMEEAKKLGKEGKSEPCAYGHLYKFLMSEEMKIARNKFPEVIYEEMWNFARAQAEKKAFEGGSPFCGTMWGDHASIDNPYCTVKNKILETYLRCRKDIKFYTKFDSILSDRSMEDFQSSMTADGFQTCVMRHLYALTLEVLIPEEKRYMEHLINKFNYWEHYLEWHSQDYPTLLEPYESLFDKLPYSCLVRGLQLHISRIPYKYTKESLPEVLKKGMLRKLKKDYKLLILKINYMQFHNIPQATMVREINTLVRHYAANPGTSRGGVKRLKDHLIRGFGDVFKCSKTIGAIKDEMIIWKIRRCKRKSEVSAQLILNLLYKRFKIHFSHPLYRIGAFLNHVVYYPERDVNSTIVDLHETRLLQKNGGKRSYSYYF